MNQKDQDSDYESTDNADFHDSDAFSNNSSDESDGPKRKKIANDLDSGDEVTIAKQKKRRKTADGDDLILTRAQRRAKFISPLLGWKLTIRADEVKTAVIGRTGQEKEKPVDLDELWKQLNSKPAMEATCVMNKFTPTDDTVKIKRSYEFAGQFILFGLQKLF